MKKYIIGIMIACIVILFTVWMSSENKEPIFFQYNRIGTSDGTIITTHRIQLVKEKDYFNVYSGDNIDSASIFGSMKIDEQNIISKNKTGQFAISFSFVSDSLIKFENPTHIGFYFTFESKKIKRKVIKINQHEYEIYVFKVENENWIYLKDFGFIAESVPHGGRTIILSDSNHPMYKQIQKDGLIDTIKQEIKRVYFSDYDIRSFFE